MKNLLSLRIFGLLFDLNGRELVGGHEDCWICLGVFSSAGQFSSFQAS